MYLLQFKVINGMIVNFFLFKDQDFLYQGFIVFFFCFDFYVIFNRKNKYFFIVNLICVIYSCNDIDNFFNVFVIYNDCNYFFGNKFYSGG